MLKRPDRPVRVGLLGDSHLSAVRQGWNLIQRDFKAFELTFFAGARPEWETISVVGSALRPASEKLREQFVISSRGASAIAGDFDLYVICGFELLVGRFLKAWASGDHQDWAEFPNHIARKLRKTLAAALITQLREITQAQILLLADPFPPEDFCKEAQQIDNKIAQRIGSIFVAECQALAARSGAVFIPQPSETRAANGVTTVMRYARASADPALIDNKHANAAYGALILAAALKATVGDPMKAEPVTGGATGIS